MKSTFTRAAIAGCLAFSSASWSMAEVLGPYAVDQSTLHLYHFDEPGKVVKDAKTGDSQFSLQLSGGAGLTSGRTGFGRALSTRSKKESRAAIQKAISTKSFWNTENGAFTFEALVRMDFEPASLLERRADRMQILAVDSNGKGNTRSMQLSLRPVGVSGATAPSLEFIKFAGIKGQAIQNLVAELPSSGQHIPVRDKWFHVAVTYNGDEGISGNCKIYWTRVDDSAMQANLLATATLRNDIALQEKSNFSVGNAARTVDGANENWMGQIDEVRISSVARSPEEFLFQPANPLEGRSAAKGLTAIQDESYVSGEGAAGPQ